MVEGTRAGLVYATLVFELHFFAASSKEKERERRVLVKVVDLCLL